MLKISSEQYQLLRLGQEELTKNRIEMEKFRQTVNTINIELAAVSRFEDRTEAYKRAIELIMSETNPYIDMLHQYDNEIQELKEKIEPLIVLQSSLLQERSHVDWWLKVYGHEAKLKLFGNVCHFLDTQVAYYLKELKNPQLKVEFSTIKTLASGEAVENFNVRVYSEKGGEGFETLSGGEQQIVSFAISKALSDLAKAQTSGNSDFEILDEPFSMLDSRNCESLIEFLGKQDGTIMLISNDEHLMNLVPERLHVEKYKGVTTVAYGA